METFFRTAQHCIVVAALACIIVMLYGCSEYSYEPDYIGVLKSVKTERPQDNTLSKSRLFIIEFEDGTSIQCVFYQPYPILTPGVRYAVYEPIRSDEYLFKKAIAEK